MNKTDYTKGKWERRGTFVYALNAEGHNRFDLNVQALPDTPKSELEANARLIAAAPEMYEALQTISKGEGRFSLSPLIHASNTMLLSCAEARNQAKADLETALADIPKVCLALFWSETDIALVKLWEAADLKRRKNTDARFLEEFR